MVCVDFKPLNVQFLIDDKETAQVLRDIADALGDKIGDRRTRGAGAAKAVIIALAHHPEVAEELLGIELPQREPFPKATSEPPADSKRQVKRK